MNVLLTAFKGKNNSSKVLLDLISHKRGVDELYLENDFQKCEAQLNHQLDCKTYDLVFSFEQKSDSDKIVIETAAKMDGNTYETGYSVESLYQFLGECNYKIELSGEAGTLLANHVYAVGLHKIAKELYPTKIVLIHIPPIDSIDILKLAKDLSYFLSHLSEISK